MSSVESVYLRAVEDDQLTAAPKRRPTAKVTVAAAMPNATCRSPDRSQLVPVTSVIAAPIPNSASVLRTALATTAVVPPTKKNGRIGTIAPTQKSENDEPAAFPATYLAAPDRCRAPRVPSCRGPRSDWRGSIPPFATRRPRDSLCDVERSQLRSLCLRIEVELAPLDFELVFFVLARALHGDPLAERHRACPREQSREPGDEYRRARQLGSCDSHDQAEVRKQAVVRAEYRRTERVCHSEPMALLVARGRFRDRGWVARGCGHVRALPPRSQRLPCRASCIAIQRRSPRPSARSRGSAPQSGVRESRGSGLCESERHLRRPRRAL